MNNQIQELQKAIKLIQTASLNNSNNRLIVKGNIIDNDNISKKAILTIPINRISSIVIENEEYVINEQSNTQEDVLFSIEIKENI